MSAFGTGQKNFPVRLFAKPGAHRDGATFETTEGATPHAWLSIERDLVTGGFIFSFNGKTYRAHR